MRACALPLVLLLAATAAAFFPLSTSTDTLGPSPASITGDNQTLVSAGGIFQLGFFSRDGGARTYLGIWYYNITVQTVVWVANRQDPVIHTPAVLRLSAADGRLVILDGRNATVWSSAAPTSTVTAGATARLLDSGNLVLSADGSGSSADQSVAWQSFDYPTDTLLPGMKLGVDVSAGITRNITAWRGASDPSPGDVTFKLVTGGRGLPQFFLFRGSSRVYTSGPWNGEILTGVPYLKSNDFTFRVVWIPNDETYYSYSVGVDALLSRLVVDEAAGQLQRFVLLNGGWSSFWYYPTDPCDAYAKCGPFGYCDNTGPSQACVCLPGFQPRSPQQWNLRDGSAGCVRTTSLSCGGGGGAANASSDGFWVVKRMKLPVATNATVYAGATLEQCRQVCLSNCSCRAYAAANVSGGVSRGCVIWAVDLLDMRLYTTDVQDVYIRLAQSEIDALNAAAKHRVPSKRVVIAVVTAVVGVLLLLSVGCCCLWRKRRKRHAETDSSAPSGGGDEELPFRTRKQQVSTI